MSEYHNIGDQIRDAVQDAINSQDFSKLNETVSKSIGTAADNIGKSLKEASKTAAKGAQNAAQTAVKTAQAAQQEAQKKAKARPTFNDQWVNAPYGKTKRQEQLQIQRQNQQLMRQRFVSVSGAKTGGYFMAIGGGILSLSFTLGMLVELFEGAALFDLPGFVAMGIFLVGGLALLVKGSGQIENTKRFQSYVRIIGQRPFCEIKELADGTGRTENFVVKKIKKMLKKGLFRQGYLDDKETCLMVTSEAYQQYIAAEKQLLLRQQQEQFIESTQHKIDKEAKRSAEVQKVLDEGNAYITKIHMSNEAIPGEEISRKIEHMENIVRKIFQRVEEHPEIIPDLEKMMSYFLPTTVKLLDAYEDLDNQPIQGENITTSKKEIEETLDTLNVAFEKLLDSIFKDMAWDVSTDISVLHTVLAQEGLTKDVFKEKEKVL